MGTQLRRRGYSGYTDVSTGYARIGATCSCRSSLGVLHCVCLAGGTDCCEWVNTLQYEEKTRLDTIYVNTKERSLKLETVDPIISVWWFTKAPVRRGRQTLQMHSLENLEHVPCVY